MQQSEPQDNRSPPSSYEELKTELQQLRILEQRTSVQIDDTLRRLRQFPEFANEERKQELDRVARVAVEYVCDRLIGSCAERKCRSKVAAYQPWHAQQERLRTLVRNKLRSWDCRTTPQQAKGDLYAEETVIRFGWEEHEIEVTIWDCPSAGVHQRSLSCLSHSDDDGPRCREVSGLASHALFDGQKDDRFPAFPFRDLEECNRLQPLLPLVFHLGREQLATNSCYCEMSTLDELRFERDDDWSDDDQYNNTSDSE